MLEFTDGVEIDTTGPLRILQLDDGCYVVGHGMLEPVNSREEAELIIAEEKPEA